MKKSRKMKRRIGIPVAAGFMVTYLLTMGLATYLVKEKYVEQYRLSFEEIALDLSNTASEKEADEKSREGEWGQEQRKEFYQGLVNEYYWGPGNRALKVSAAVYDEDGKLLVKSCDTIGDTISTSNTDGRKNGPFVLDDYLSFEQKEELAEYYWKRMLSADDDTMPEKYRILIRTSPDGRELYDMIVQEITWEEGSEAEGKESISSYEIGAQIDYETGLKTCEDHIYYETDSKVVWEWVNPDVDDEKRRDGQLQNTDMVFRRMDTYEEWHRWSVSEYLHEFPEKKGEYSGGADDSRGAYFRCRYQMKVGDSSDPYAYMEIRIEENPWFMAIDYMKFVFGAGLILALGCIVWIIHTFHKIYDQQTALEETRRDITNAMAHELKTPLGIIRNFAENLIEHNMEAKRDYYLSQIIGQTEEMDDLVAEMIEIAKLDTQELTLKKETVSFSELIQEQMERFKPLIAEKNLKVQCQAEEDFQIDGDREYLAKAVWNLLSNAVDHNVPDGRILVNLSQRRCSIENTGAPMEAEQLRHAFDLFYTRDRSRSKKEKHRGLGLFLAQKILALHKVELMIENTDCGVRVVMYLQSE